MVAGPLGAGSKGKGWNDDLERAGTFVPTTVGALTDGAHQGGGSMARTPTLEESLPRVAWCLQERDAKGADSDTKPGHLIPTPRGGFPDDPKPTPFDTTQITSKENRSQPQPGDPSHPLAATGHPPTVAFSCKDNGRDATENLSPTLRSMNHADSHANGGGQVAIAFSPKAAGKQTTIGYSRELSPNITCTQEVAIAIQNATRGKDQNGMGVAKPGDPMFTLDQASQHAVAIQGVGKRTGRSSSSKEHGIGISKEGDPMFTLNASEQHGVAFKPSHFTRGRDGAPADVAPPLMADADKGDNEAVVFQAETEVRRLTPRECERLQGFPDDWTLIPWSGKPADKCPDGPRYRALGNSMATTVMAFLGIRIQIVDEALYP